MNRRSDMTKPARDKISFAVMAALVFILSQFFLSSSVSTGPNEDLSLGWLDFHRHGWHWSFVQFHFGPLIIEAILSVAFTWVMSKALRHRIV
jgi:hypothetical protein